MTLLHVLTGIAFGSVFGVILTMRVIENHIAKADIRPEQKKLIREVLGIQQP